MVRLNCGWKTAPAIRSDTLTAAEVVRDEDGLRVTAVLRTLLDVGRFVDADTLELAVEHALRGVDRRRPDIWNESLWHELNTAAEKRRVPGSLRIVLARRAGQRPTGSYAETILGQGLRTIGADGWVRQASIVVLGAPGPPGMRRRWEFFPDFADLQRGLLIEVDGRLGHDGDANVDRDDRRQNLLTSGFRILRFHARSVLAGPIGVARAIEQVRQSLPLRPAAWTGPGVTVERHQEMARLTFTPTP